MSDLMRGTRSPWYATPVVAVALLAGLNGLTTMVVWGPWLTTVIGLIAIVTIAISVTRMLSSSRIVPTLVGAIVAVLASIPAFARGPEGQVRLLPTPTALRELAGAVREGVHVAATTVAPAEINRPLLALVMCGAFAIFLLADHLAVSWRAAALSGLVLLAPWMPAITLQHRVSLRLLMLAIGCWVILLALTKRPTGASPRPSTVGALTAAAATLALVALVAPTALAGNGWGMIPRITTPKGIEATSRLNLALDLRTSLTANSSSPILVYISTGDNPEVFRTHTLSDFDGAQWSVDDAKTVPRATGSVLWSTPLPDWDTHPLDRIDVSVQDFVSDHLPLPTVPRTVDVPGSWTYSPSQDVVSSATDTTQWLDYSFNADLQYFSADSLRALGDASADDASLDARDVSIPVEADAERFAALAAEVTQGATTRYDQAVAIQEYFRDPANFTYTTAVDPEGSDSVSVFLDSREGYCVQFASGMVMLARSLGIPARLAIGFLPGTPSTDSAFVVRGGDAHAWPELYFAGAGWVRFEPTPSVQTGVRPSYATPEGKPIELDRGEVPVATSNPSGAPLPNDEGPSAPVTTEAPAATVPWPLIISLGLLVAIALGGASWWIRRRRADDSHEATPETVWTRLRTALPPDTVWSLTLTPYEAVDHVTTALASAGGFLASQAQEDFAALSVAVADYRYAPEGTVVDTESLEALADEIIAAVIQARGLDAKGRPVRGAVQAGSRPDA